MQNWNMGFFIVRFGASAIQQNSGLFTRHWKRFDASGGISIITLNMSPCVFP